MGPGNQTALEQLTPLVYTHLRAQARRYMRHERSGVTLQSTALVHEVYLRLIDAQDVQWHDRLHFFALSARLMRRILVDAARTRAATKRGGSATRVEHASAVDFDRIPTADASASSLCALDDALEDLTRMIPDGRR